jgi:hypothetical protein
MTVIQLNELVSKINIENVEYNVIDQYSNSCIELKTTINSMDIILYVSFPRGFPYKFPEISIRNEEIKNMPHIDNKSGKLCLFKQDAIPNHKKPTEIVEESIRQAIKIVKDGIDGFNKKDFIEEFNAYWCENVSGFMDMLFDPSDVVCKLICVHSNDYTFWACGDSSEKILNYAKLNYPESELTFKNAIYIPLKNKLYPPFPSNNKEFFKFMQKEKHYEDYKRFLTNKTGNSIVVLSQKDNNEYILSVIIHTGVGNLPGFRNGKIEPRIAYLGKYASNKIVNLGTNLIQRKRLFFREEDGKMLDKKVSILGCGSLGGYLVDTLAELGINNFKLMDNELLTFENVARHVCGIRYVNMPKVEAIRTKLLEHYPELEIKNYNIDIYKILEENLEELDDRDIKFVAVGDKSLESYIINLYNNGKINGKVIILWVEPYVIGGHAIILNTKQEDIEEQIYDNQFELKDRILEIPGEFTKKEAGCQNTFVQYSGFEANLFIHTLVDNLFDKELLNQNKNYLLSVGGKINWAREQQFRLTNKWIATKNRSIKIEELQ